MDGAIRSNESGGRERLAWGVLLGTFAVWLAVLIAVPILAARYIQEARRPMVLAVQADEGTVGLSDARGRLPALLAGEPPQLVEGQAGIVTNATDTALVRALTPDESEILARVVIYGGAIVDIVEAESPRFGWSEATSSLVLDVSAGRIRINLPPRNGHPLEMRINTPQGGAVVLREPGQYTVDVSNLEAWVMVQEGSAETASAEQTLSLQAGEGAVLREDSGPQGPTSNSRNLVVNGDFNEDVTGWDAAVWEVQRGDQNAGITSVISQQGERVLRLHRVGEAWAGTQVRQPLNQQVLDLESLHVLVTVRVMSQSVEVCGQLGSECPLMVVIQYEDVYGADREWQQGFYAFGTPIPNYTPDHCTTCSAPLNTHVHVPLGELRSWESENLLEKLAQENRQPRRITGLVLKAQGHTFDTHVFDVALIAR
jgi:hypothetical protein